jgi:ATP synthase subunit 6
MIFSPLEQFEIFPLIPFRFGSLDLSFTNSTILIILSLCFFSLIVATIAGPGNGLLVPSRWQLVLEGIYTTVLDLINNTIGSKNGSSYVTFIFSLFSFLLFCNLLGLVPYSFTATSHLAVTVTLGLAVWVGKLVIGVRNHGLKLAGMFLPQGLPLVMIPALVAIEILSFAMVLISLPVRLFANMMSGHILLKVLAGFAWSIMASGGVLFIAHFAPLLVLFGLMFLETGVAMVQAYVFTLLTCIYISDAIAGGHLY